MAENFERWFDGAPVLQTGATGDFSVWKDGAPVLQLQPAAVVVQIVGSGGVEVGGAATIEVVVGTAVAPFPPGYGSPIAGRFMPEPERRRVTLVFEYRGQLALGLQVKSRVEFDHLMRFGYVGWIAVGVSPRAVVEQDFVIDRVRPIAEEEDRLIEAGVI